MQRDPIEAKDVGHSSCVTLRSLLRLVHSLVSTPSAHASAHEDIRLLGPRTYSKCGTARLRSKSVRVLGERRHSCPLRAPVKRMPMRNSFRCQHHSEIWEMIHIDFALPTPLPTLPSAAVRGTLYQQRAATKATKMIRRDNNKVGLVGVQYERKCFFVDKHAST